LTQPIVKTFFIDWQLTFVEQASELEIKSQMRMQREKKCGCKTIYYFISASLCFGLSSRLM